MIDFLKIFEENGNRFAGYSYEMQRIMELSTDGRTVHHLGDQGVIFHIFREQKNVF
jgi:hypothetical protein